MPKADRGAVLASVARGVVGVVTAAMMGGAGCSLFGISEEEAQAEFNAVVQTNNSCSEESECAIAYPSCPLGCFVAVRADRKDLVERRAREIISDYERGGAACAYDCATPGTLDCVNGRCGFR